MNGHEAGHFNPTQYTGFVYQHISFVQPFAGKLQHLNNVHALGIEPKKMEMSQKEIYNQVFEKLQLQENCVNS
jgi:hypothetical protein